jgi:hypothetical protein
MMKILPNQVMRLSNLIKELKAVSQLSEQPLYFGGPTTEAVGLIFVTHINQRL